jgi:hypothetical protein
MTHIPDLVLAQLDMHVAKTRLDLETIKTKLEGERVQLTRSRVLRAERDRLTAELQAWEYVRAHAAGVSVMHDLEERFPREESTTAAGIEPAQCDDCDHRHARGIMCTVMLSGGHCGCKR